uniref:Uncharacterized protein n=1 Tax=Triticum urartu TaxID=4572 RepID=A0A8R7UYX9_TRIUA
MDSLQKKLGSTMDHLLPWSDHGQEDVRTCSPVLSGGLRPAAATTLTASIDPGSFDIWIDRCSLIDYDDGLINITCHSIEITASMSFCCLSLLPSHSMLGFSQQISLITLDIVLYW